MRTLEELIGEVDAFFKRADTDSLIQKEESADENVVPQALVHRMSLLEIACLGNAEKTLQGELFFHLRSVNWNVVLEIGYLHAPGIRRNPDIGVFDSFGQDKKLICVIEMKHYSANQGSAIQLTKLLDFDYELDRPLVPLMQIGLYTSVSTISPSLESRFENGIYRFLNTYCNGVLPPKNTGNSIFSTWCGSKAWLFGPVIGKTESSSFIENGDSRNISGYIEYVVGIRN